MNVRSAMRRFFSRPRDTVARWIALTTILAIVTSLLLNGLFGVLAGVWGKPSILENNVMEKMATAAHIINAVPASERDLISKAASDSRCRVSWLKNFEQANLPPSSSHDFEDGLRLMRNLLKWPDAKMQAFDQEDWDSNVKERPYVLMIQLQDSSWVQFSVPTRSWGLTPFNRNAIVLLLVIISVYVVALFATRHLAAPLEKFSKGARRFGRDFNAPPIPVAGPYEIRHVILAFNAMQAQIQHFLSDRTQMLAAISHDLRAPLTRMRLRGEFIEDPDQQARLFRDVDEMQAMIDGALNFFRDNARFEPATAFNISEMVLTIVDDYKDAGVDVSFDGPYHVVYTGRPIGLKRAVTNLLDNAIKYGAEPSITLRSDNENVFINVLDRGPGIPVEQQEQVFFPFYRIEGSRNRNTGGVGLGLSAARASVLEHGGTLIMNNRRGGGLQVTITLPLD